MPDYFLDYFDQPVRAGDCVQHCDPTGEWSEAFTRIDEITWHERLHMLNSSTYMEEEWHNQKFQLRLKTNEDFKVVSESLRRVSCEVCPNLWVCTLHGAPKALEAAHD